MSTDEAERTWKGEERAVNGAAGVLGAFRRNYADVHGVKNADPELVKAASNSAVFLINSLLD